MLDLDYLRAAKEKITSYGTIIYNEVTSVISLALKEIDLTHSVIILIKEYLIFYK